MKIKLFSRHRMRRPRIDQALAFAAAVLMLCATASAGAPDWMRQAARVTAPKYPDDTNIVILLEEHVTTVDDHGEIRTVIRRAFRILRPQAHDYGIVVVPVGSGERVTYLKGWAITPDNKEFEIKEKDCVETSLFNEALYEDAKHRVCQIPAAKPGSVLGYEFEVQRRPDILQDEWNFQEENPVLQTRFELHLPRNWEYSAYWINHATESPQDLGKGGWAWNLQNVSGIDSEPSMPSWEAVAGRLAVTFYGQSGPSGHASPGSWEDVARGYERLTEGRVQANSLIKQKVLELTNGKSDVLAKINTLADFVQHQVRYVAIEIGIGGYQPHSAGDIFNNMYGDCKDKATLLSAMLGAMGVESYYVLVNSERNLVEAKFPSMLNFNHVILAIRISDANSTAALFATGMHKSIGTVAYFDPTDSTVSLGYLPWQLQGAWGLIVEKDGGELIQLPVLPASANRLERVAKVELSATGDIQGDVREVRSGEPAFDSRALMLNLREADLVRNLEEFVGRFMSGGIVSNSGVQHLSEYESPLVVQFHMHAQGYAKSSGKMLLLRPRLLGQKSSSVMEEKERKYPVEFANIGVDTDTFEFKLPEGYLADDLPDPVNIQSPFGDYQSKVELAGNSLKYHRSFTLKALQVSVDRLPELKKFYREIDADEHSIVILRPGKTP